MTLAATASWLISLRDSSLAVAAVCGAIVAVAAAIRIPGLRRPILWVWHQLTEDAIAAYWRRHGDVAASAVEPRLLDVGARIGELRARVSTNTDTLFDLRRSYTALATRVETIERSCSALPAISEAVDDIAHHTETDRRHGDKEGDR